MSITNLAREERFLLDNTVGIYFCVARILFRFDHLVYMLHL